MKNTDDDYIRWCLRAALFPANKDPQLPSKYSTEDDLNFKGVSVPTPLSQLDRVERRNRLGINIYVYCWEDGGVVIHRLS